MFAEDEAIISLNPTPIKLWTRKGSKPTQLVNGSHSNVCFLGAVSDDKIHCVTAETINQDSFLAFIRYLLHLYKKIVVLVDHATYHLKSKKVKKYVKKCKGNLILWPLPKKLPELNPMEHGWRSLRQNVTYKLHQNKKHLAQTAQKHLHKNFKINLNQFWS